MKFEIVDRDFTDQSDSPYQNNCDGKVRQSMVWLTTLPKKPVY